MTEVDEDDPRAADGEVVVHVRHDVVGELRKRACGLDARGPGADHDEVQRALVDEIAVCARVVEQLQNS